MSDALAAAEDLTAAEDHRDGLRPAAYRRILLKVWARPCSASGSTASTPSSAPSSPVRSPRSIASAWRSASSWAGATSSAAGGSRDGHGPGDRRLHRHARDGDERPGAPGRARAGRRPDAGHDGDRHERGRRAVHPAPRRSPPREGCVAIFVAGPATRTSPPTRPPPSARSRSAPRSSSRRPCGRGLRCRPDEAPGCAALCPSPVRRPATTSRRCRTRRRSRSAWRTTCRSSSSTSMPWTTSPASPAASRSAPSSRPPPSEVPTHEQRVDRGGRAQDGPRRRCDGARLPGHPHRARLDKPVERITVDYYGTQTPLNQLAGISVPEAHQSSSSRGIAACWGRSRRPSSRATSGCQPNVDGTVVRLNIPPLTEERRKEIVRLRPQAHGGGARGDPQPPS